MYFKLLLISLSIILFKYCDSKKTKVFEETNGYIAVEAEDFHTQELDQIRKWYRIDKKYKANIQPDIDSSHASTAS